MNRDKKDIISFRGSYKRSYRMFKRNYRHLIALLDKVEAPEVAIRLHDVKHNAEFFWALEEIAHLLHNLLASAKSLIDHTRAHMHRLYEGNPFLDEYKARVEDHLASSPVQRFVQDLRNYTQHCTLPEIGSAFSWGATEGLSIAYYIDAEKLRKWDNWSPESWQYLDAFRKILPVRQLAGDYFSLVDEFYKWLDKREREGNIAGLTKRGET